MPFIWLAPAATSASSAPPSLPTSSSRTVHIIVDLIAGQAARGVVVAIGVLRRDKEIRGLDIPFRHAQFFQRGEHALHAAAVGGQRLGGGGRGGGDAGGDLGHVGHGRAPRHGRSWRWCGDRRPRPEWRGSGTGPGPGKSAIFIRVFFPNQAAHPASCWPATRGKIRAQAMRCWRARKILLYPGRKGPVAQLVRADRS